MRVVVLGGTRFIGRAIVDELLAAGHDVLVVHRGTTEPDGLPDVPHVHVSRRDLAEVRGELSDFRADAFVDTCALGADDTDAVLDVVPHMAPDVRLLVLSSMDVYAAYGALHAGTDTEPVPLDETSPVRAERFPFRGQIEGMDDYEKLDVEERYLARGGIVCRLPMVYGEHDYQRREEFVLRRVRAGRERMPFGAGTFLWTKGYVGDVAAGVRLVLERGTPGETFNLGERRTWSLRRWAEEILAAAGARMELVRVPSSALPPDLGITGITAQHLLVDSGKARHVLGWADRDPGDAVRRSVAWHLEHPPDTAGDPGEMDDFAADEAALAEARA